MKEGAAGAAPVITKFRKIVTAMNNVALGVEIFGVGDVVDDATSFVDGPEFDVGFPFFEVNGVRIMKPTTAMPGQITNLNS